MSSFGFNFIRAGHALGMWICVCSSECMGKTFQAAMTCQHMRDFWPYITPAKYFFYICKTELPRTDLWCVVLDVTYSTTHQRSVEVQLSQGLLIQQSLVEQISIKYFAGVIYGQKSLMCQLCSLKCFPHKFTTGRYN